MKKKLNRLGLNALFSLLVKSLNMYVLATIITQSPLSAV